MMGGSLCEVLNLFSFPGAYADLQKTEHDITIVADFTSQSLQVPVFKQKQALHEGGSSAYTPIPYSVDLC